MIILFAVYFIRVFVVTRVFFNYFFFQNKLLSEIASYCPAVMPDLGPDFSQTLSADEKGPKISRGSV